MSNIQPAIQIDGQTGNIESVYVSPLGFLMIKVHFPDRNVRIRYNMGKYDQVANMFLEKINNS